MNNNQEQGKYSPEFKITLLKKMVLIRRAEEKILALYRDNKIYGAIHLSIGQEAVAAGVCQDLRDSDSLFSTHRCHGHAIAKGCDVKKIFAELMGKDTGLCRGHGGSMHLFEAAKGFMGGNGIVGGSIPLALGPAFASQYAGKDDVSVCIFSEGASNQGVFHESLNLAALWKLPVIYVCEHNCYAATTRYDLTCARHDIAERSHGYGIPGEIVDGNEVIRVYDAVCRAIARARRGDGPSLVECKTYRMEPHGGILADRRPPREKILWRKKDPILRLKKELEKDGLLRNGDMERIETKTAKNLDDAILFGLSSPDPDPVAVIHATCLV